MTKTVYIVNFIDDLRRLQDRKMLPLKSEKQMVNESQSTVDDWKAWSLYKDKGENMYLNDVKICESRKKEKRI